MSLLSGLDCNGGMESGIEWNAGMENGMVEWNGMCLGG